MRKIYIFVRKLVRRLGFHPSRYAWIRNTDFRVRKFLGGEKKEYTEKEGLKIYLDPTNVFAERFKKYEPETTKFLCDAVKDGGTLIDIGASIGWFSLMAAKQGAKVIAIEPHSGSCEVFRKSIEANSFGGRINLIHAAAADAKGKLKLYTTGERWQWSSTEMPTNDIIEPNFSKYEDVTVHEEEVDKVRVDDIAPKKVDVIKMDVEGIVDPVFDGMRETIRHNPQAKILIEYPTEYITKELDKSGYKHRKLDGLNTLFEK